MALDDVRHVEAVAILRAMAESWPDPPSYDLYASALQWCEENRPSPEAYMAAMTHLAKGGERDGA